MRAELSQLWQQHHLRGRSRDDEPNAAGQILSLLSSLGDCPLDPFERGREFLEETPRRRQ